MSELKFNVETKNGIVTILEGKAPEQKPLLRNKGFRKIGGTRTVLEIVSKEPMKSIIENRVDEHNDIFLLVDRDNFSMILEVNTNMSNTKDEFITVLKLSKKIQEFGINEDKSWTTFDLANFIKMNRTYFETKQQAMELVTVLRNFKAKVDKDIENADDTRGNKKLLLQQTVDSNIPESFNLTLPIFKGLPNQTINVEVMIDASDFSCRLISPDASDFIETESKKILDEELDEIKELHPNLKVIELV